MKIASLLLIVSVFISSLNASANNSFKSSVDKSTEIEKDEFPYHETINKSIINRTLITTQNLKKTSETIFGAEKQKSLLSLDLNKKEK
ncbi:hypothetical protein [Poseidonibacter ostreae]|uniref:Uncharacterized protein n=1 Tax=Poseidonibacter ostreae TaxID=2654171 RepID=A0A6L4WXY6_9BACT|nr:hypothetical protein [Poseidonibacter ostreae]KAB7891320.1 hypothetical protein GBG19_00355 [Poseidonibacter ostreae]